MELLTAPTKTDQVVEYLSIAIESQKLKPGDKLLSTRKLAQNFSTSQQVIKSAYNILEKEGLVFKRARSGVFVCKPAKLSHLKDVYILGAGVRDGEPYFNEIQKLATTSSYRNNFTFLTRTYPPDIPTSEILEIEKMRISKMNEIDCIVISAVMLNKNEVKHCFNLGKPVIFVGDFSSSEMECIELNQITGDNTFHGEEQADYMIRETDLALTLCSGSLTHLFNRQFYDGVRSEAEKTGVPFNVIEFPRGASSLSEIEQRDVYAQILRDGLDSGVICGGMITAGVNEKLIHSLLKELDSEIYSKLLFMPQCHVDYSLIRKAIIARIEDIIANDHEPAKIRLKLPMIIN